MSQVLPVVKNVRLYIVKQNIFLMVVAKATIKNRYLIIHDEAHFTSMYLLVYYVHLNIPLMNRYGLINYLYFHI
jgi:hypothetical protein